MSSSFLLPLRLNPPPQIFHGFRKNSPSKLNLSTSSYYSSTSSPPFEIFSHNNNKKKKLYTFSCVSSSNQSSSSSSSWEREEERWMREERRWLREEKRWLREESRWNSERQSLLQEIATLKFRIQTLERQNSRDMISSDTVSNISPSLLHVEMNRISEIGSGPGPILFHSDESEEEEVKEIRVFEKSSGKEEKKKKTKKIPALRKGAEGEDVRAMQDALQKLGFYSGEEDMEFSSFSSGTERAIKTWQATLGVREDGIMTEELLERLFVVMPDEDHANGATIASMTETSEFQQTVKESSFTEVEASHNRVFLLGENRWEEPSRLTGRNKLVGSSKMEVATTKCLVCRGEGRVLCLECDGTGEPNVEPQFLEWVDEGAKCPYCEGLGYNICDVCEGKTTTIPVS
ncbi:Peptidoglycan binding-like [Macleaya cordata]|uniref:Peptidoglycan binding-like n=1 Tax=Macleaya cordata TaxID=56857 RepID=A0A200QFR0_MACCD|nr:Peptidoglycan binding-like [Macleaya cordata]